MKNPCNIKKVRMACFFLVGNYQTPWQKNTAKFLFSRPADSHSEDQSEEIGNVRFYLICESREIWLDPGG